VETAPAESTEAAETAPTKSTEATEAAPAESAQDESIPSELLITLIN